MTRAYLHTHRTFLETSIGRAPVSRGARDPPAVRPHATVERTRRGTCFDGVLLLVFADKNVPAVVPWQLRRVASRPRVPSLCHQGLCDRSSLGTTSEALRLLRYVYLYTLNSDVYIYTYIFRYRYVNLQMHVHSLASTASLFGLPGLRHHPASRQPATSGLAIRRRSIVLVLVRPMFGIASASEHLVGEAFGLGWVGLGCLSSLVGVFVYLHHIYYIPTYGV